MKMDPKIRTFPEMEMKPKFGLQITSLLVLKEAVPISTLTFLQVRVLEKYLS